MKKTFALILALVLVLSLAACGGKETDGKEEGGGASALTDDELVEKLTEIMDGKTGEMPVENTSFQKLSDNGIDPTGLFANWFNQMEVPEGALIAVNQPLMGQAHVVLLIQPGEGSNAEDLAKELEANANPGWNICMTADTVDYAVKDGLILFVMTDQAELGTSAADIIAAFKE